MCESCVRIRNKSKRVDEFTTPLYYDVPCGHCKSCESQRQNDWFVRAVAEYKRCVGDSKRPKGFVWFPTLTYAPGFLPVWNDKRYNFSAPVFDKRHFVSFRNKLRIYLKRAGYDLSGDNTMRYMYVTEYGGKRGRPHIHCLLFVPLRIPFGLFKQLVKKAWIYGMVRYSPQGDSINSVKALNYTMKYLAKDMAWLYDYGVPQYLQKLKSDWIDARDITDKRIKEFYYKEFRKYMPHHCQSMGFGSSFNISDEQFENDEISASELSLYDGKFRFKVPMYYRRKFLYDFDKNTGLYTINQRGLKIARSRFDKLVMSLQRYVESRYDTTYFDDLAKWFPDLEQLPNYDKFTNLCSIPSDIVAKYMLAFRNVRVPMSFYSSVYDEQSILDFIDKNAYFYFITRLDNGDLPVVDDCVRNLRVPMFNDVKYLSDIEDALQFIQNADKMIAGFKHDAYLDNLYHSQIQFKFI